MFIQSASVSIEQVGSFSQHPVGSAVVVLVVDDVVVDVVEVDVVVSHGICSIWSKNHGGE